MRVISLLATAWVLLSGTAAPMSVPPTLQAVILKKTLQYNRALEGKFPAWNKVVVVSAGEEPQREETIQALREAGFSPLPAKPTDLGNAVEGVVAVYLLPGVDAGAARSFCSQNKVLSVSGDPALAEGGTATLAFSLKADGKPQIIVNLKRMKDEGQEFNAQYLALTKVVQ